MGDVDEREIRARFGRAMQALHDLAAGRVETGEAGWAAVLEDGDAAVYAACRLWAHIVAERDATLGDALLAQVDDAGRRWCRKFIDANTAGDEAELRRLFRELYNDPATRGGPIDLLGVAALVWRCTEHTRTATAN